MNTLRRILLARTSIQSAVGITFAFVALLVDSIDPQIALGVVGVMFAWMAVTSEVVFGQSLEELDDAVNERAAVQIQAAVAVQRTDSTPDQHDTLDHLLEGLLASK